MEKARTVPDSYPLTLNSLLSGCNQRTSRDPLLTLDEAQVQQALDALEELSLVRQRSGGRVARWEHNFQRALGVPDQSAAILGLLMLRGPQTAAELRSNAERWHRFAGVSSVEAFLEELQQRDEEKGGPLVVLLPRAPGMREPRWAHLLCGPVDAASLVDAAPIGAASGSRAADSLQSRVESLESELAALKDTVRSLCAELGLSPPGPPDAGERDKTRNRD